MNRFDWRPRRRVGVVDPHADRHAQAAHEPVIDTSDLSVLVRAYHGREVPPVKPPTTVKSAQLTIARRDADDFQDRQILLFVDDEPWGRVRYGCALTRDIAPGPHRVRAFNTLFSKTVTLDVKPGEHVRLRTGNGFPKAGWLLMLVLHVTYLMVRLEREPE
jgi:hypothetical protein